MNINKYIKNIWVAACILMGGTLFNSCTDELDGKSVINTGTEGINLSISVDGMREKVLTRVTSERKDKSEIHDLHIILASGDDIKKVFSVESTETGSDQSETSTGLEPDPSFDTGELSYHISQEDAKGADHVYVVANYMDDGSDDEYGYAELAEFPIDEESSVSDLKALKVGFPAASANPYCTMFGEVDLKSDSEETHDNHTNSSTYSVELKRTLAMITVGINATEMRKGVIIRPTGISLKNVPKSCWITKDNIPTSEDDDINSEGPEYLSLNWDALATHDAVFATSTPEEPHADADGVIPLFMFENKQGKMETVNTDQTAKEPPTDKENLCTYIEVVAEYEYYKEVDDEKLDYIPNVFRGTMVYRFYLGNDITSDFNIERNKHYQLTLNLKGWAGLVEEGKITDGTCDLDNEDVYWRVDSDLTKGSGFMDSELDLPIGGSQFDLVVATDNIDNTGIKVTGGNSVRWIWVKTKNGWVNYDGQALNKDFIAIDNGNGTYTFPFYAKPWTWSEIEDDSRIMKLRTVNEWIESGYREIQLSFPGAEGSAGLITIRQWLPLPVMDPEDLKDSLDPNDPHNAKLYYSRIDVNQGNELRWGPSVYDNIELTSAGTDHKMLITDATMLGIKSSSDVPSGEFNPQFGFHNQVAFFVTDQKGENARKAINFDAVLNQSAEFSMMDWVTFISANAEDPGPGELEDSKRGLVIESSENATGQHHYALASKEEWEKIVEYGVLQNFLPISYWTSNMEGTQSYVYNPIERKASLKPRSGKYRGRMVYHKNNEASF